jgi:hypothetical protein
MFYDYIALSDWFTFTCKRTTYLILKLLCFPHESSLRHLPKRFGRRKTFTARSLFFRGAAGRNVTLFLRPRKCFTTTSPMKVALALIEAWLKAANRSGKMLTIRPLSLRRSFGGSSPSKNK